jgi:DNA replication protein DnaC
VLYQRVPRLFAALALARGDGRYAKLLHQLARVNLLILDDWGPEPLLPEQQRDLLEIVAMQVVSRSRLRAITHLIPLLTCVTVATISAWPWASPGSSGERIMTSQNQRIR